MSTTRRRRSYEAGHKPKWLVVIDDTAECDRAVYFAARRAARVGAGIIMLRVIETHDRNQQWAGVADIMKAEAHEEANAAHVPLHTAAEETLSVREIADRCELPVGTVKSRTWYALRSLRLVLEEMGVVP